MGFSSVEIELLTPIFDKKYKNLPFRCYGWAMDLLRFSVSNFRSISEDQTIHFTSTKKETPLPVVALFGANASGKSNVIDALGFALSAIKLSATEWQSSKSGRPKPHYPFKLSEEWRNQPSSFEFEFIHNETRYIYGFSYSFDGIHSEWLSRKIARWTSCLDRERSGGETYFNPSVFPAEDSKFLTKFNDSELFISAAIKHNIGTLGEIGSVLLDSIVLLPLGEMYRDRRISQFIQLVRNNKFRIHDLALMLQAADTGIVDVRIEEEELPEEALKHLKSLIKFIGRTLNSEDAEVDRPNLESLEDEMIERIAYVLRFVHWGENGETFTLEMEEESTGTLLWLSLAPVLLDVLRNGKILVVDELDSSLHSAIVSMVVECFSDPTINTTGAQLFFSSHNTNILEQRRDLGLTEDSYWFVSKNYSGASEYRCLSRYPNQLKANYEKRYLDGNYGAVPYPSPSTIRGLVSGEKQAI